MKICTAWRMLLCVTALAAALTAAGCDEDAASAEVVESASAAETETVPVTEATAGTETAEEESSQEESALTEEAVPTEAETTAPEPVQADYTIVRTDGEIDWGSVPVLPIDQVLWKEDAGVRAEGQLCYDSEHLYVHLRAVEQEIRAENTEPLSPVYQDSCLEFFFMPEGWDKYFNIEINPNGCVCMQYGASRSERFSLVRGDITSYFDIRTDRTEDGWEVYYTVPLDYFRYFIPEYEFDGVLLANFYKCGDKTVQSHYLAWQPVETEKPDYHRPEYFGRMAFGD